MADEGELTRAVAPSGFPLQMRIRDEIEERKPEHGFSVVASDHPWRFADDSGFVDLVITKGFTVFVIDCKKAGKQQSKPWVFLIRAKDEATATRARCVWCGPWIVQASGGRSGQGGYEDVHFEPASHEAEFCAIEGTKDRRDNLLERVASTLVDAASSVVGEQQQSTDGQHQLFRSLCVPLIVTTADLHVAPTIEVSLEDGSLERTRFDAVDVVRLRKALGTARVRDFEDLRDSHAQLQRTVFVVRAKALVQFLKDWRFLQAPQWPEIPKELRLR
jgi:hypothetical protein